MARYLDFDKLEAIDPVQFRNTKPYPWTNPRGLITPEGYEALRRNLPELDLFAKSFGYARRAGQASHDRYSLEYSEGLGVPAPWIDFISELRSDRYRNAIARLFDVGKIEFRFHWHYAPRGCSVSPHCDAKREYGSHLFYLNSEDEWDAKWGGETLVLDDGGRCEPDSAPSIEEFEGEIACESLGNVSAILRRSDRGWHAVRVLTCPEDRMRKIFIVVINPNSLFWKVRDRLIGKTIQRF